jgi:hypothetical protein
MMRAFDAWSSCIGILSRLPLRRSVGRWDTRSRSSLWFLANQSTLKRRDFLIWGSGLVAFNQPAKANGVEHQTNGASELAQLLADEFAEWHRNLAEEGVIPRAFTGVTATGKQAVVILTGLPLNHTQRRQFLIWLSRTEGFVGYAYSTQVGISSENGEVTEALDIYASSAGLDISKTLLIERRSDGKINLLDQHNAVLPPKSDNGPFFGLQRSSESIPAQDESIYASLWQELKTKAMWRKRP